jgi:hypothetical protein
MLMLAARRTLPRSSHVPDRKNWGSARGARGPQSMRLTLASAGSPPEPPGATRASVCGRPRRGSVTQVLRKCSPEFAGGRRSCCGSARPSSRVGDAAVAQAEATLKPAPGLTHPRIWSACEASSSAFSNCRMAADNSVALRLSVVPSRTNRRARKNVESTRW